MDLHAAEKIELRILSVRVRHLTAELLASGKLTIVIIYNNFQLTIIIIIIINNNNKQYFQCFELGQQ